MKKPPIKQLTQEDYIKTSLRLPRELHAQLTKVGDYYGRTLNAEIVHRLQSAPVYDLLQAMARENAEMKAMIKELYDLARK